MRYAQGGRLFKLSFARSQAAEWNDEQFFDPAKRGRRGKCRGFSFGSRRRMLDQLNSVSCAAENPDMVTLTLPDECFNDSVTLFAKEAKSWLDAFLKRLKRVCPSACGFWRIEWKARKSGLLEGKLFPHFHLIIWGCPIRGTGAHRSMSVPGYGRVFTDEEIEESFVPVEDRQGEFLNLTQESCGVHKAEDFESARAEYIKLGPLADGEQRFFDSEGYYGSGKAKALNRWRKASLRSLQVKHGMGSPYMSFRDWAAVAWYHVVDSHNLKHFDAGTRVERIRSFAGVAYCAKAYLSKTDAENFLTEIEFGRSWGIFGRANMPWAKIIELDLSPDQGVRLRRIARRYLEHRLDRRVKRPYGVTLYCATEQWSRLLAVPPDTPF